MGQPPLPPLDISQPQNGDFLRNKQKLLLHYSDERLDCTELEGGGGGAPANVEWGFSFGGEGGEGGLLFRWHLNVFSRSHANPKLTCFFASGDPTPLVAGGDDSSGPAGVGGGEEWKRNNRGGSEDEANVGDLWPFRHSRALAKPREYEENFGCVRKLCFGLVSARLITSDTAN